MSGKKKNTGDAVDQNGQELAAADMVAQAALRAKPVKPARHRLIKEDPPFKLDFTVYNFTERARKDV